ncbi:MAG: HlyC/CorC family transporter, partial [Mariprofundus sp.]
MDINGFPFSFAIGTLFFLLLLSAFFSGSETALTRARKAGLRARSEQGDKGSKKAETLLDHPERMLSTILLGNNFVNIFASALATALFVEHYGQAGIIYATIAMTAVVLIFAEILPKTIAVAHAEDIACKVAGPMHGIQTMLAPLVTLLMAVISLLKRLLRVPDQNETPLTHKELASMIDISAETGVLDQAREQMLNSSLTLHEVAVKAVMTPRKQMHMLDGSRTVAECLKQASTEPHSRHPVFLGKPDNLIGIVHLRNLLKLKTPSARLCDAMIWKSPPYIPTTKNALAQLFDFQANHQHMAIIVDEFGDIEGLITLEDIIEEIVGEIQDEHEKTEETVKKLAENKFLISGNLSVRDWSDLFGVEVEPKDVDTIGGFIVSLLEHIPKKGDSVRYKDFLFTVDGIRKRRITSVSQEIIV